MKKITIFIILGFLYIIPNGVFATVAPICPLDGNPSTVIKNELPCVKVSDCGEVGFINECEEDVYYTDLEYSDFNFSKGNHQQFGFNSNGNEVTLSRKSYSSPIRFKSIGEGYYRRINYGGGGWLPYKVKETFCDEKNNQTTIKFRKGSDIYKIVTAWPCGGEFPVKGLLDNNLMIINFGFGLIIISFIVVFMKKSNLSKTTKGFILLLILFGLLTSFGAINYLEKQSKDKEKDLSIVSDDKKDTSQNKTETEPNFIHVWEKYNNLTYGFEFEYIKPPKDTKPEENDNKFIFYLSDSNNVNIAVYKYEINNILSKELYDNLERLNKDFENFTYKSDNSYPSDMPAPKTEIKKIKIDNIPAIDYIVGGAGSYGRSIYILKGNKVIDIFHNAPYINIPKEKLNSRGYNDFEKFLGSIKFR